MLDQLRSLAAEWFSLATKPILYLVSHYGPPYPQVEGCAAITAFVMIVAWLVTYFWFKPHKANAPTRNKWLVICIVVGVAASLSFVILHRFLTFRDDSGTQHAKGFVEREEWKLAHEPLRPDEPQDVVPLNPNDREEKILKERMGYNADIRWVEWSISIVEVGMLMVWIIAAASWTIVLGIAATALPVLKKTDAQARNE